MRCAQRGNPYKEQEREAQGCNYGFARSHKHITASGNHDDIASLKKDILLGKISLNNFLVIEWMLHLLSVFCSKDVDIFSLGKLRKTARAGKRLQDSHVRQERESAGVGDFAGDVNTAPVDLRNCYVHLGTGKVFRQALAE